MTEEYNKKKNQRENYLVGATIYDSNKCTEQQYFTTQTTCRKPVESVQISYKAADVRNALLGAGQKRHLVITRKN